MNRNEELKELLEGCNTLPHSLDDNLIIKSTKKRVLKHKTVKALTTTAYTIVLFLTVFTVCVNTSRAFSRTVSSVPILKELARLVNFNKGYEDAVNHKYVTEVNVSKEGDLADVYLDYVMSDRKNLILFLDADVHKKIPSNEMLSFIVDRIWDLDTGKEIDVSCASSDLYKKDSYSLITLAWEDYHRNIQLDLTLKSHNPDCDIVPETYRLCFEAGDCLEEKIYNLNASFNVRGYDYEITQIRMYPMSTEIDVSYIGEESSLFPETLDTEFYIRNDNETRTRTIGLISKNRKTGSITEVIESGYYLFEEGFYVGLSKVELLPWEYRDLTVDFNTGTIYDSFGIQSELEFYEESSHYFPDGNGSYVPADLVVFKKASEDDSALMFFVTYPSGEDFPASGSGINSETGEHYMLNMLLKDKLVIENGITHVQRNYPKYIEYPDWEIRIE